MTGGVSARGVQSADQQNVTARFMRMLSLALEQVLLIRRALVEEKYRGLHDLTHALERELDLLERELEDTCLSLISGGNLARHELGFYFKARKYSA